MGEDPHAIMDRTSGSRPTPPEPFAYGINGMTVATDPEGIRGIVISPDGTVSLVERDGENHLLRETQLSGETADQIRELQRSGTEAWINPRPDGMTIATTAESIELPGNLADMLAQGIVSREVRRDPKTGHTTTTTFNEDGTGTVIERDEDGLVVSRRTAPAEKGSKRAAPASKKAPQWEDSGEPLVEQISDEPPAEKTRSKKEPEAESESARQTREARETKEAEAKRKKTLEEEREAVEAKVDAEWEAREAKEALEKTERKAPEAEQEHPDSVVDELIAGKEQKRALTQEEKEAAERDAYWKEVNARGKERADREKNLIKSVEERGPVSDWEKDAAAGMDAVLSHDGSDAGTLADAKLGSRLDVRRAESAGERGELDQDKKFDLSQGEREKRAREERLAALDEEKRSRDRADAERAVKRYADATDKKMRQEGRTDWTEAEYDEYLKRERHMMGLSELSREEEAEINRLQRVRDEVNAELHRSSSNMGLMTPEEVRSRAEKDLMHDAGTKGWRNLTLTGRMVSEVHKDMTNQRELLIQAQNDRIAGDLYLKRKDITPDQRYAAEQFLERARWREYHSTKAIDYNEALIAGGTMGDVATLGAARPVAMGGKKAIEGASKLWAKLTETGAKEAATATTVKLSAAEAAGLRASTVAEGAAAKTLPPPGFTGATTVSGTAATQVGSAAKTLPPPGFTGATTVSGTAATQVGSAAKLGAPTASQVKAADAAHASLKKIAEHEMGQAAGQAGAKVGTPTAAQVKAAEDAQASLKTIAEHAN